MSEKFQRFVLLMTAVLVMSFSISYVVSASTDLYTSWQKVFNAVWSALFGGGSGTSTNTNTTNTTPSTSTNQSTNTNATPGTTPPNVNIVSATGEKIGNRIFMERDGANNSWIGAQGSGTDSQRVAIGFNSDPTTGLIKNIYMRTNDQMRLAIDSNGNLGVGGNIVLWGDKPTYRITNVASPVNDSDVATKGYVDAHNGGNGGGWTYCRGICVQSNTPVECEPGEVKMADYGYGDGCYNARGRNRHHNHLDFENDDKVYGVGLNFATKYAYETIGPTRGARQGEHAEVVQYGDQIIDAVICMYDSFYGHQDYPSGCSICCKR